MVDTRALAQVIILNELIDSDEKKTHRGKTRWWVKRRSDQGYFNNITGFKLAVRNSQFAKRFGSLQMSFCIFSKNYKSLKPDTS